MHEEDDVAYDRLGNLTQQGLRAAIHSRVDEVLDVVDSRVEQTELFLERICSLGGRSELWFRMWQVGRPLRFNEVAALAERYRICSRRTAKTYLDILMKKGLLARTPQERYVTSAPAWFLRV